MLDTLTREALWRTDLVRIVDEMDAGRMSSPADAVLGRPSRRCMRKPTPWWEE